MKTQIEICRGLVEVGGYTWLHVLAMSREERERMYVKWVDEGYQPTVVTQ